MEWEVLKGGTLMHYHSGHFADSNRKHTLPDISPQEDTYFTTPAGSVGRFSTCLATDPATEKP